MAMGTAEAMVAAVRGTWDVEDQMLAIGEKIRRLIADSEVPAELHMGKRDELFGVEVKMHMYDQKDEWLKRLADADQHVRDAILIYQEVMAEVP